MQQDKGQEVEVEPPALTTSDSSSPQNEKLIATETNDRGPIRCLQVLLNKRMARLGVWRF